MADVRKLMAKRNNLEPATRDQKIGKPIVMRLVEIRCSIVTTVFPVPLGTKHNRLFTALPLYRQACRDEASREGAQREV